MIELNKNHENVIKYKDIEFVIKFFRLQLLLCSIILIWRDISYDISILRGLISHPPVIELKISCIMFCFYLTYN